MFIGIKSYSRDLFRFQNFITRPARHSNLSALAVHMPRQFFFRCSSIDVCHILRVSKPSKLRSVGSMLELVLGGVLEAFWDDLGRFLGGQDVLKTSQDGAKTGHVGIKTG